MSSVFANAREAVRIKVKKCDPNAPTEWRKFSVDPQITSIEVLYSLLAKAFEIKFDFSIKYKTYDGAGNEVYMALLSDWDLDAAFLHIHNMALQAACEPCLMLQIDVKPFTSVKEFNETTISSNQSSMATARELISPLQQTIGVSQKYVQNRLPGLIINQVEKTFSLVQRAFTMSEDSVASVPPRLPLADHEFRLFLDALGQIQRSDDLRKVIFFGGIDASLRRVVWKHILNVYPAGMNGHQRMTYMRRKSEYYYKLRDTWKLAIKNGSNAEELAFVTSMVKKDVLRTDRLHAFYAGNDDNQNIASLFNILTTYALNHPSVSYCQGMSDIASPLLVTMNDEAQAYICFCAVMSRMRGNFMIDGIAMTQKFSHLTEALSYYDPDFWEYLQSQQADDLLFCYRWLLLELKREFPFEDALRMLEVQWSSLKYENSQQKELRMFEKEFSATEEPKSRANSATSSLSGSSLLSTATANSPNYLMAKSRESPYTKVCALRRQCSSASLSSLGSCATYASLHLVDKLNRTRLNHSLDENVSRRNAGLQKRASAKAHRSMDEGKMLELMADVHDNFDGSIDDDEVFLSETNKSMEFLSTNPFKEDAQLMKKQTLDQQQEKNKLTEENEDEPEEMTKQLKIIPSSIAKLEHTNVLTNFSALSDIIVKQMESPANNVKTSGGHFKLIKEKIAASRRSEQILEELKNTKQQQKLVKNFNEFLNFTSTMNKNRVEKLNLNCHNNHNNNNNVDSGNTSNNSAKDALTENSGSSSTVTTVTNQNPHTRNRILNSELNDVKVNGKPSPELDDKYFAISMPITEALHETAESLERQIYVDAAKCSEFEYEKLGKDSLDLEELQEIKPESVEIQPIQLKSLNPFFDESLLLATDDGDYDDNMNSHLSSLIPEVLVPISTAHSNATAAPDELATNATEDLTTNSSLPISVTPTRTEHRSKTLPPPTEFGGGNPFLIFLCLTLLLQHRNTIMKEGMDYNEIAMYFDKMVRKHDVTRVLNQARRMYIEYLKDQNSYRKQHRKQQVNGTPSNTKQTENAPIMHNQS